MTRTLLIAFLLTLGVATAQAQSSQVTSNEPLTLHQLEQMALEANPTLAQAAAAMEAAQGRARQAGTWLNPTIGYTGEEISRGPVIRGGEHGFFAEQTIPLGGKLRLSREVFDRVADEAQSRADLQRQRVVASIRVLFYEALTAERRVDVSERLAALATEAVDISRQLFNTGAADRPDVLEAEIEARRIGLELEAARNEQFTVWRRIAAVVNEPTLTSRPLAAAIDTAIPELERAAIVKTALDQSPAIRAARAAVERTRAVTALARRETYPDLFLRGSALYNRELLETGGRPVGWEAAVSAGISVPLFNRNRGGIAAARADETAAQTDLRRLELALETRVAEVFKAYLTALRASEEYRSEVLPRAEEAYALYLDRYRNAAAAYPQVLIAQRTLFQMNAAYLENLVVAWRAALQLQGYLPGDALEAPTLERAATEPTMAIQTGRLADR